MSEKMRVLWVTNIVIPQIARKIGMNVVPVGGWMVKFADEISQCAEIDLSIAFPYKNEIKGRVEQIDYYGFSIKPNKVKVNNCQSEITSIEKIIKDVSPECIHIFGTEEPHSYVFVEAAIKLGYQDKIIISIQGLKSIYAKHYEAYLPHKVIRGFTLRDLYKGNIIARKKKFEKAGSLEIEAIRNVHHVIGRTDWDKSCTSIINPNIKYHFNNEMLRDSFYTAHPWSWAACNYHSIFMSQATLPLKGLHIALEAVTILKPYYSDLKLRIAGKSYTEKSSYKLSNYERFVLKMIKDNELGDIVEFTGFLDERQMVKEYKQCNVFVCTSSIENSPNSVCEAMMLGVPVVSSHVGGVSNLLVHGLEGFLYQADAPYMLSYYIRTLFDDPELSENMSNRGREHARKTHNVKEIVLKQLEIYKEIKQS